MVQFFLGVLYKDDSGLKQVKAKSTPPKQTKMYLYVCICVYMFIMYYWNDLLFTLTFFYLSKYIIIYLSFISKYTYNVIICIIAVFIYYSHLFIFLFYIYKKKNVFSIQKVYTIYWHAYRF